MPLPAGMVCIFEGKEQVKCKYAQISPTPPFLPVTSEEYFSISDKNVLSITV